MSQPPVISPSSTVASPRGQYEPLSTLVDIDQSKSTGKRPDNVPQPVGPRSNKVLRKYFVADDLQISRARTVLVNGKQESKCRFHGGDVAARIPDKTSSFKLVAAFNNCRTGHYTVQWRVKLLPNFSIPNGLHFVVNVSYDVEPDVSGSLDVILPAENLQSLASDQWCDLVLDEKLVIQPHLENARIQAALCNNENIARHEYSGIVVEHVEIRSISHSPETKQPASYASKTQPIRVIVPRAAIPKFNVDSAKARPRTEDPLPFAPVTRLATSKTSHFIASLALSQDTAYITVWDMSAMKNMMYPAKSLNKVYKSSATAVISHPGVGDLAIGLALSTNGDQVAVFEEPKIGYWADGSKVGRASFPFRLFNNPLVPQASVAVPMPTESTLNSNVDENSRVPGDRKFHRRKPTGQSSSTQETLSDPIELEPVEWEHDLLKTFVGFGSFLPESKKGDWEKNDVNSALTSNAEEDDDSTRGSKDGGEKGRDSAHTTFVACNGIYIDVFRISLEKRWKRIHTITLTDLLPTHSRRITCKMMMESISNNTFMWLEDNGRSCTIWNLLTGSNITHISSVEGGKFRGPNFRGHSKMAISPHESIIALASADGSLTTYFANTGMAIDDRKFPGYKIEYLSFHAQDDMLFVILRSSVTFELSVRVLDTLQLKSEVITPLVPIPSVGSTLLAFFSIKGFWNRGVVCEPDGSKINFYISYQPTSSKNDKSNKHVIKADPDDLIYESSLNGNIQYRLMTAVHSELLPEGDGVSYWVLRVEVVEENLMTRTSRIIFSFVPEPWMRTTTSEVVHPENLQSTFFIPCGTRFAVVGMQTLQIWNLPTADNVKCSLQCIWSQPKDDKDLISGAAYKSPRVRDYYLDILGASIFMDTETGNTTAEIKMNDKSKKKPVTLPGPRTIGARNAIGHCFRSIHLLAAAYAFSRHESNRTTRDSPQWTFTFEDHAEAIARFTREHINRMMSINAFSPRKRKPNNPQNPPRNPKGPRNKPKQQQGSGSLPKGVQVDTPASLDGIQPPISPTSLPIPTLDDHIFDNLLRQDDSSSSSSSDDEHHGIRSRDGKGSKVSGPGIVRPDIVTVLTLLLDQPNLQHTNHIFVEGLLRTENGDWIPRDNKVLNPIKRVIEARNGHLVEVFIDYCIKNAKKYHPAYLMPAVQCLNELSDRYPTLLADMFRKASFVPVHNYSYVATHAVVANPQYDRWLKSKLAFWKFFNGKKFEKSNNINDYSRPVFSLRSQLPFRATNLLNILNIENSVHDTVRDKREDEFPMKPDVDDDKNKIPKFTHKIYVAPFPKLSMYGPYRPWYKNQESSKSAFVSIAGEDFFDSPAMRATLQFKWYKFGFSYWLMRFLVVLTFFTLIVFVTAKQIQKSQLKIDPKVPGDSPQFMDPTPEEIESRYLLGYRPAIKSAIGFGFILIGYEFMQFYNSPRKYIRSPYNYMDLAAYVTPVIGCFAFMNTWPGKDPGPDGNDIGPTQEWVLSFAILFLYLNILFELRVIKQLGIVVNIILNITKGITWFFLIVGLFLISFTHALLHLLHTRRYQPCSEKEYCETDFPDGYPQTFSRALFTTFFFLGGRFDSVESSLNKGTTSYGIMMVTFYFFTTILLLNILIALMNDAYNESKDQGQLAWLKQWSEVISEVEIFMMTKTARQNRNYFPDYIYYGASEQEAELYESQFNIANRSNLSIENRFLAETIVEEHNVTQFAQRTILRDLQLFSREIERMKQTQDGFAQDITKLTRIVAAYLDQTVAPSTARSAFSEDQSQSSPIEFDPPASGASASEAGTLGDSTPATPLNPKPPFPLPLTARMSSSIPPSPRTAKRPLLPASMRRKVSTPAEITESPVAASPTVHFNSPQDSTFASPVVSDTILAEQETTAGPSTSAPVSVPTLPPGKELTERDNALRGKSSHSSLKRRLPLKLAVVHTMDDALKAHRQLQNNNASHPLYVKPTSKRGADEEVFEADDEDQDGSASDEVESMEPVHHSYSLSRRLSEDLSPLPREDSRQFQESMRRTQSEALLTTASRPDIPPHHFPPIREDSSNTAENQDSQDL
ncbi:hypothetical protein BGX31_004268 [Mortierella sp. GBA43]|nr:hypothetical protein BGX31_004268 [Mortierella sp. GBA43]